MELAVGEALTEAVNLRVSPEVFFTFDESLERGDRIERLLREVKDKVDMPTREIQVLKKEIKAMIDSVAVMRDREMVAQLDNDDTLDADRVMRTIASGTPREEVTP